MGDFKQFTIQNFQTKSFKKHIWGHKKQFGFDAYGKFKREG